MQLPAKTPRVAATGLSVLFDIGLHGGAYVRTDGRSGGSDVITKPKFLALKHYLPLVVERSAAAMFVLFVPSTRIFQAKAVYMVLGSS